MTQPPTRLSPDHLHGWLMEQTVAAFDYHEAIGALGYYTCRKCGAEADTQLLSISVHSAELGDACAGRGEVQNVGVPRCPACEPDAPTALSTCMHVPMFHSMPELVQ